MKRAHGKYAKASCDRCGCMVKYGRLKPEYKNQKRTGLLTCNDCWDGEHPQDAQTYHDADAQTLAHPRPRNERSAERDSPKHRNAFSPPKGVLYEDWLRGNA